MDAHPKNPRSTEIAFDSNQDEQWLADLPNDLGAISLSSDRIPALNPGKMGCVDEKSHETGHRHHKHDGVGL